MDRPFQIGDRVRLNPKAIQLFMRQRRPGSMTGVVVGYGKITGTVRVKRDSTKVVTESWDPRFLELDDRTR